MIAAIPWHGLYAVLGLILALVLLYIAFWTLIYAMGILSGLLAVLAGWAYAAGILLANAWRLPWHALAFPVHCALYLGGWRSQRPRIVEKWEYGMTPRAAFGLDCVLWLMIWAWPALILFAYLMPWIAGPVRAPYCALCYH